VKEGGWGKQLKDKRVEMVYRGQDNTQLDYKIFTAQGEKIKKTP